MIRKVLLLISLILLFSCNKQQTHKKSDICWVAAEEGLRMRSKPSISSEKLDVYPYGYPLKVQERKTKVENIEGINGVWVKVEADKTGWMFDGFLSDKPVKPLPAEHFHSFMEDLDRCMKNGYPENLVKIPYFLSETIYINGDAGAVWHEKNRFEVALKNKEYHLLEGRMYDNTAGTLINAISIRDGVYRLILHESRLFKQTFIWDLEIHDRYVVLDTHRQDQQPDRFYPGADPELVMKERGIEDQFEWLVRHLLSILSEDPSQFIKKLPYPNVVIESATGEYVIETEDEMKEQFNQIFTAEIRQSLTAFSPEDFKKSEETTEFKGGLLKLAPSDNPCYSLNPWVFFNLEETESPHLEKMLSFYQKNESYGFYLLKDPDLNEEKKSELMELLKEINELPKEFRIKSPDFMTGRS